MTDGPPQPDDDASGDDHVVLPTPKNGDGTYGVYSKKKGGFVHGQTGLPKGEARRNARGWNKKEKK